MLFIYRVNRFYMLVSRDKKWDYAIGMIKVDGLEPTPEMRELIEKEKRGEITMEGIKEALDRRYKEGMRFPEFRHTV